MDAKTIDQMLTERMADGRVPNHPIAGLGEGTLVVSSDKTHTCCVCDGAGPQISHSTFYFHQACHKAWSARVTKPKAT